ncbi:hypothetical protein MCG47_00295 [Paeniclostridium sordellii]|nr:hypothetical protein [Paeniclostridium sordellii]
MYSDDILKKIEIVKDFYEDFFNVDNIKEYLFCKTGQDAIEHVFRVSAGLDSIVLGEDQILGQVKDAHEFSKNNLELVKKYLINFLEKP